jgi:REP element-mobilizing transposase RayT
MAQPGYILDARRRNVVLQSCVEVCQFRDWWLFVVHVRSNHVHVVVQSSDQPERVMNSLKAYASRALTKANFDGPERQRWARHGSTRYLWNDGQVRGAIKYVLKEQGEPMAVYIAPGLWRDPEPRP